MRVIERKRPPFMTKQRWLFVIVAVLLLFITIVFIYFRSIQQPQWSGRKEAQKQAVEYADLTSVDAVYQHIWNKESWVVKGRNEQEDEIYVWLSEEQLPEAVNASESLTEQQLSSIFKNNKPDAEVKRIQPGLLDEKHIWEVYYSEGDNPKHYYYDFYSFDDGSFINSYKLLAKTEP